MCHQGTGYECTQKLSVTLGRKDVWGIEKLRAYIATVKSRFRPTISHDASVLLERHYSICRSSVDMSIQITVRFLESLIRLAQAHASLMHRNVVELDDAVAVILLMESSVASCTHNSNNFFCGDPTSSFPDENHADIEFLLWKVKVLEKYEMQNCLTPTECSILEKEQKRVTYDVESTSWDNIQDTYHETVVSTPVSQKMDHYGRFTQKTTPSPSRDFNNQRLNFDQQQVEFPITFPEENPPFSSSHKKRKNYSAD